MGVEPFLVASATNLILAQRLARRICADCKETAGRARPGAAGHRRARGQRWARSPAIKGTGCANCSDTGYKGRIALYEVMPITDELKELILNGASAMELKELAIAAGDEDACA